MSSVTRIALLRHGETEGESSVRYHGATDVALSAEGRAQVLATARRLGPLHFDLVVSSPLRRARSCAAIVAPGRPVRLEHDFREVHFGRWEGRTAEEIEAMDPVLYREWRETPDSFAFPEGDLRSEFRARVERGLERLLAADARSILVLCHMGVARTVVERLTGAALGRGSPGLGELVSLGRVLGGGWRVSGPAHRIP